MANKWITALKEWNAKHNKSGKYLVPKKGTKEYMAVKKIMAKMK